ncbi:MAG: hypothetical protein NT031_06880, partial [Planctomycetota bacterium]|nr:hypothetical protein [Planctomycetota bacterium]
MKPIQPDRLDINRYTLRQVCQRMWPLVRPHRWPLAGVVTLITASGLVVATVPMFGKYIVDVAIPQSSLTLALQAMAVFLALQVGRLVLGYVAQKTIVRVQERVVFALRAMSFRHIQRLCLRFHGRCPSGFLHDRVFIPCICRIGMLVTYLFDQLSVQIA